jgi:uncharacterized surface protein with fasciclin (FAS1) repeats
MGGEGGTAGMGGEGGTAGMGGEGGTAGMGGEGGTAGTGGVGGVAGMGGEGGVAGMGGAGGAAGMGGVGGAAGMGGVGGAAGMGGVGGVAGMGGAGGVPGQEVEYEFSDRSAYEIISNEAEYSTFVRLVQAAEVEGFLSSESITLMAPSNIAMMAYEVGNAGAVARMEASAELSLHFVMTHTVRGKYALTDFAPGTRVVSHASRFLDVVADGDGVTVGAVALDGEQIAVSNGYVHPLATVIQLPVPARAGTCAAPLELNDDGWAVGSTVGSASSSYSFTAGEAGTYCVDTIGSSFNTVLTVLTDCDDPGSALAENDNLEVTYQVGREERSRTVAGFAESRLTVDLDAGQVVALSVGGGRAVNGVTEGDFVLSASAGDCAPLTNLDWLTRQGDYTILIDLLTRFGLVESQLAEEAGTLLAPSDAAFASMDADDPGSITALAADGDLVFETLNYHHLLMRMLVLELADAGRVATAQGLFVEATERGNDTYLNGVRVDRPDAATDNGYIQGLEGVMELPSGCMVDGDCEEGFICSEGQCLPPRPPADILEELRLDGSYDTFVSLIEAVELEVLFATVSPLTVFAPTDATFGAGEAQALLADSDALYDRLVYHVVNELVLGDDLANRESLDTELGLPLPVEQAAAGLQVGGVSVTGTDHVALNGTIHTVADLLTPPAQPNACDMPIRIEMPGQWMGSTEGAQNDHASSCALGSTGPENAYVFTSQEDVRVCFDTLGPVVFDTSVHIREAVCGDELAEIGCNDDCVDGQNCNFDGANEFQSALTLEAQAGVEYFVFVDGVFEASGDYVLNLTNGGCFEPAPQQHLVQTVTRHGNLNTFAQAINAGGLQDLLSGNEQYTVFAPTDEAFVEVLGEDGLNDLLADRDRLIATVEYHLVAGRVPSRLLEGRGAFMTVEGGVLHSDSRGGDLMVGGASVSERDIQATNGIVHVVDSILVPPAACMNDGQCDGGQVCGADGLCEAPPVPGTCESPFEIVQPGFFEGDTSDQISNELAECVGVDDAPDHIFTLSAQGAFEPFPGIPHLVCLSTLGSAYDTVLHVRNGGCDGAQVACDDDSGGDEKAQLTLEIEENATYTIIVDGVGGASGQYLLTVANGPCE